MDYEYLLKNFLDFKIEKEGTEKYIEDYKDFLKTLVKLNEHYFRIDRKLDFFSDRGVYKKL